MGNNDSAIRVDNEVGYYDAKLWMKSVDTVENNVKSKACKIETAQDFLRYVKEQYAEYMLKQTQGL